MTLKARIAELEDEVLKLRAELVVRTHVPGLYSRPIFCRTRRTSAPFDAGYSDGWRDRAPQTMLYTAGDRSTAYVLGYEQGQKESEDEIQRVKEQIGKRGGNEND